MKELNRKIQIGVMGSMADLNYSKKLERIAAMLGFYIAKNNATLIYGAEKDSDSLSTVASRATKKAGGLSIGVTYGKGLGIYQNSGADVVIASGLERGGGRELSLVLSCDVIICLGGGSGTLTEMAIAYQANIPIVVIKNTGGWSSKLSEKYFDARQRIKVEVATTPKQAVKKAIDLVMQKRKDALVLTAVHGDEPIGIKAMKIIDKQILNNRFAWVIANKKALNKKTRFIKTDLNRVAPGNKFSKQYEKRRAFQLLELAKKYSFTIDIHSTTATSGIFSIVTNPSFENLALAALLPIKNIVIWDSRKKTGPITKFVERGLEIECGPKNSRKTLSQLVRILKTINSIDFDNLELVLKGKNLYQVYGKVLNSLENIRFKFTDFTKMKMGSEEFYPLLVGQYKEVICYKMKKISEKNISHQSRLL